MAKRSTSTTLRIGVPGKEHPHRVFLEVFGLTLLTCGVLFAVAMPSLFLAGGASSVEAAAPDAPQLVDLAAERLRAMDLTQVDDTIARWDIATQKAALVHGPRHAAEALCERVLSSPQPLLPLRDIMATSLSERAEHAPRTCLLSGRFTGRFDGEPRDALATQVDRYWTDVAEFETEPGQNAFLVNSLRQQERLPVGSPEFVRWLRRCATRSQDLAWLSCVRAMRELAPHQGRDLLEMAELHLIDHPDSSPTLPTAQLIEVANLLEMLGKHGQPQEWRVETHETLLNYDYDLRLASIFQLCRFTMSNDRGVAKAAGEGLAEIAGKQVLMSEQGLFRLRDTCRIVFGGNRHDLDVVSVPVLATNDVPALKVLRTSLIDTPRYAFADLIERGDCVFERTLPLWYCGARLWKGQRSEIAEELGLAFINTRYVEWAASQDIPDVDSDLLRDPPAPRPDPSPIVP